MTRGSSASASIPRTFASGWSRPFEARPRRPLGRPRVSPRSGYPAGCVPSNWYLTGFLIPSGTAAREEIADADEDDDLGEIPGDGRASSEESNEERKAAKKGFFPSSMGLSFLVRRGRRASSP